MLIQLTANSATLMPEIPSSVKYGESCSFPRDIRSAACPTSAKRAARPVRTDGHTCASRGRLRGISQHRRVRSMWVSAGKIYQQQSARVSTETYAARSTSTKERKWTSPPSRRSFAQRSTSTVPASRNLRRKRSPKGRMINVVGSDRACANKFEPHHSFSLLGRVAQAGSLTA